MTILTRLRRFLGEVDAILEHARTGRAPAGYPSRSVSITPRTVDGWYNFHADATRRTPRH